VRKESQLENIWYNGDYPQTYGKLNWILAFGASGSGCFCCSRTRGVGPDAYYIPVLAWKWILWRVLVFVYLVGVWLYSMIGFMDEGRWFQYLTNWQTSIFALYGTSALATCIHIHRVYQEELKEPELMAMRPENYPLPWYAKLTWVLQGLSMSAGIYVTFLYWTFVFSSAQGRGLGTLSIC
jgi:hypothetical protein